MVNYLKFIDTFSLCQEGKIGHIVQVGNRATEEAAREWEETKHKS